MQAFKTPALVVVLGMCIQLFSEVLLFLNEVKIHQKNLWAAKAE
jgi:hypothetical protein